MLYALSSDHGNQDWTEASVEKGRAADRPSMQPMTVRLRNAMLARWGTTFSIYQEDGLLYGDTAAMHARGIDLAKLSDSLAREARTLPGVYRVYTPRTLTRAARTDTQATLWRRGIPRTQGWFIAASAHEGYVWERTDHGSTALADQRVPIAFWGMALERARPSRVASTTDIGPTLAALLGVSPTEPVTGKVLPEVVPPRASRRPLPRGLQP